ncbi:MAG: GDSL-type esterase/lipase family protein [candidate division KSB1 bacterium]|nr:GDSL-type esterase/lipase family protein [candidate division KSB1 bacterium]MDZ7302528.1 GDSL-type esterase/lipase family protein [candidate division KSB1 bacterium]MDZ7310705.1 GDSL-type esterase/lipase family protein [candidate division KSB1 bacterium]
MKSEHTPQQPQLSPRKKRVFRIALLLLPVVLLAMLELTLRLFEYGGNLDLLISAPEKLSDYKMCNRNVGRRFFYALHFPLPGVPKDLILKKKPKNGYRIFVLGESTAAGFPYGNNVMFSRILHHRLAEAFPERHIEVMNTAMAAINSYALLDFMDEILAHEPDAILIYSGHNEFYGALGVASMESVGKHRWVVKMFLQLTRFRTFLLVRDFIGRIRRWMGTMVHEGMATDSTDTLMERIVADQTIVYGSRLYELGKRQFEANLRAIYQKAKDRSVPVLASELVNNVRDQAPFVSQATDSLPSAMEVYRLAQSLEAGKKYAEAKREYERAKDLDALRFRAAEEFNEIIHRVAAEFSEPVVPMKSYFEKASPNGLVGNNLMTDHLHPNIDGYFLMADAFFEAMHENKFIADTWDLTNVKPDSVYPREWGLSKLDTVYAELGIRLLKGGWPFQPKSAPNRALQEFQPKNEVDSMAVAVLFKNELNLEKAHLELALRYARQGLYPLVFQEYKSLYHTIPYEVTFYERAAEALWRMKKFDEALPILFQARKVRETGTGNKMIGFILLRGGKAAEAIPYLERARIWLPNDPLLMQNLGTAYIRTGRVQEGMKLLTQLQQTHP